METTLAVPADDYRYTYFDAFRCLTPTVFLILLLGTAVNLGRLRQ